MNKYLIRFVVLLISLSLIITFSSIGCKLSDGENLTQSEANINEVEATQDIQDVALVSDEEEPPIEEEPIVEEEEIEEEELITEEEPPPEGEEEQPPEEEPIGDEEEPLTEEEKCLVDECEFCECEPPCECGE